VINSKKQQASVIGNQTIVLQPYGVCNFLLVWYGERNNNFKKINAILN
jgi:hypothetical protein